MSKYIGEVFSTWRIDSRVGESGIKRYYYNCTCISCGEEKQFMIHKLKKGNYAACKNCGYKNIKNLDLIRKHWNPELNKREFTNPKDFNLSRKYWFMCDNGHNFKSNIKDFNINNCTGCKESLKSNINRTNALVITQDLLKKFFKKNRVVGENIILIEEISIALVLREEDRYTNYKNYYRNEDDYIDSFMLEKKLIEELQSEFTVEYIYITENINQILDQVLLKIKNYIGS